MRRKVLCLLGVLLVCCVAVVGWFNLRSSVTYADQREISREEALRVCPEVGVTESDRAMMEEILTLPAVQDALANKETAEIAEELLLTIKNCYAPSDERFLVFVTEYVVYAERHAREDKRTILSYYTVENRLSEKLVATYQNKWNGENTLKTLYGTDGDERFYKIVEKRDWFYFLKE